MKSSSGPSRTRRKERSRPGSGWLRYSLAHHRSATRSVTPRRCWPGWLVRWSPPGVTSRIRCGRFLVASDAQVAAFRSLRAAGASALEAAEVINLANTIDLVSKAYLHERRGAGGKWVGSGPRI